MNNDIFITISLDYAFIKINILKLKKFTKPQLANLKKFAL